MRDKIAKAVSSAGDVGPRFSKLGPSFARSANCDAKRCTAKHDRAPASAFGASEEQWHLQWIQRFRLLTGLGIGHTAARSIVLNNIQYPRELKTLQTGASA